MKTSTLCLVGALVLAGCEQGPTPSEPEPLRTDPPPDPVLLQRAQDIETADEYVVEHLAGAWGGARDINEAGYVTGHASDDMYGSPYTWAFLWSRESGMVKLGSLIEDGYSFGRGLNEARDVVGESWVTSGAFGPVVWPFGEDPMSLAPGGWGTDVNDLGQVVGSAEVDGRQHAFVWSETGGMADLGATHDGNSGAWAINDAGQIVGSAETSGVWSVVRWASPTAGMVDLGIPGWALDIAETGQVAGFYYPVSGESHAFLWTEAAGLTDLGKGPGQGSIAQGVNDRGQAVGWFDHGGGGWQAVLWEEGIPRLLPPLGTGQWAVCGAYGVNNRGDIVGQCGYAYNPRAVLWTIPVPTLDDLVDRLDELLADDLLPRNMYRPLMAKLEAAVAAYEAGDLDEAAGALGAFINQVEALVRSDRLAPSVGDELIHMAREILESWG